MIYAVIVISKICIEKEREKKKKIYKKFPCPSKLTDRGFAYLPLRGGTSGLFNTASIQSASATLPLIGLPV